MDDVGADRPVPQLVAVAPRVPTSDGDGFRDGSTAHLVIQAPLPYQLRCDDPRRRGRAAAASSSRTSPATSKDPRGSSSSRRASGSPARLAWTLDVQSSLLRPLATIGRPALSWAHDRIVERGLVQFEARALQSRAAD